LSVGLALVVTWVGLGLSYFTNWPVGFTVTTLAFLVYVLARVGRALAAREGAPWTRRGAAESATAPAAG
jgi:zinc/manganese transport system permease protein